MRVLHDDSSTFLNGVSEFLLISFHVTGSSMIICLGRSSPLGRFGKAGAFFIRIGVLGPILLSLYQGTA